MQFRSVFSDSVLPCLLADPSLQLVWRNPAAEEADPGLRFPDGLVRLLSGYDLEALTVRLRAGESLRILPLLPPFSHLPLSMTPLTEAGALLGVIVMLPPADRAEADTPVLERISAAFSHEYRAPLSTIFTVLPPLVKRLEPADHQTRDYLQHIAAACYRMLRTTAAITDYARISGGLPLRMRNGDFVALVRELCEGAAVFLAGQPQLTFRYQLPDQPVITAFDPVEMSNALLHLLLNAAASRREDAPLTLRLTLTVEGETLHLALSDDGIGIPPDILAHICEPYVSRTAGIGLGLPLVRGILAAHGGTLAIESTPGTGTTAAFYLPIRPDPHLPDYVRQAVPQLEDRFSPLYIHLAPLCPERLLPRG